MKREDTERGSRVDKRTKVKGRKIFNRKVSVKEQEQEKNGKVVYGDSTRIV